MTQGYRIESGDVREDSDPQRAAERYMRAGLAVIPVPAGEKNPNRPGWQNERHAIEDIPKLWTNGQGVGVLWGEPSGGLVDIDCDWPEARAVAPYLAPNTRTFERSGAPASHYVLRATGKVPKTKRHKVPGNSDDNNVVELLSTGTQSLVPPSFHHSGERREWYHDRAAAEVDGEETSAIASDIATAALLLRHYPGQGNRHDYVLAASGYLGRHLDHERAERIMRVVVHASGDEEASRRTRDISDTLSNLASGHPTTGGSTLEQLAPGVVDRLQRWHGLRRGAAWTHQTTEPNGGASPPPTAPGRFHLTDVGNSEARRARRPHHRPGAPRVLSKAY